MAAQPERRRDAALPLAVKKLPVDLTAVDAMLSDPELLMPLVERWRQEFEQTGRAVLTRASRGSRTRPTFG
jgi:hypothetical protein